MGNSKQPTEGIAKGRKGTLEPPKYLSADSKRHFRRLTSQVVFRPEDAELLATYCDVLTSISKYTEIIEALAPENMFSRYGPHPCIAAKNRAVDQLRKLARELGIGPAARRITQSQTPRAGEDDLESLLAPEQGEK